MSELFSKEILKQLFRRHGKKIKVFLKGSQSQGAVFDPFRDTNYTRTTQSAHFIRAVTRTIAPNSLIVRELGLIESGAIYLLVKNSDVEFIRLSEKILVDEKEYYVYNDAVGNRLQIFELPFGYSRIIVFRKDK